MAIDQAQFDTDLAGFITAVNALITASTNYRAAVTAANAAGPPPADLSAEDASLAAALTGIQAEAAALGTAKP